MNLLKPFLNNTENSKALLNWFGGCFTGLILIMFLSSSFGVYFNRSDSFPERVFLVKKSFSQDELLLGTIITTKVDFQNAYVENGKMLIKQIACKGGDVLETRGKEFFCNGHHIATALEKDSQNRAISQFHFTGTIPDDMLFLTATNPKSFDSRYFGLIPKNKISEVAIWKR